VALLTRAGLTVPAEQTVDGRLDRAADLEAIVARVRAVDATFTSRPIDALAAAYPFLSTADDPVTSGPFRLEADADVGRIHLVRNDAHALGAAALEDVDLVTVGEEGAAVAGLRDGSVDVRSDLSADAARALANEPGVRLATYPDFSVTGLTFDLHPEAKGLFLDRNLRQALALCFDHAAAVTAAVGDAGVPIDTEIPAMSWAYPATGLASYPLDEARATALIEASGWTRGSDGIYEQGTRRLSTVVPVRDDAPERVAWLEAVAAAVRRCGIDLQIAEVPFAAILKMLAVYPHVNAADPDGKRPFDAYFGGFETGVDPDPYRLYHSSQCTSAEQPDTYNVGCYANVGVDRLIEAARVAPDLTTRTALYRQSAARISEDLPILFAWSDLVHDGVRASVGSTAPGGLALDTPTWWMPPEALTNVR
jgi:peptide/nickel transport system substrate-binding protein